MVQLVLLPILEVLTPLVRLLLYVVLRLSGLAIGCSVLVLVFGFRALDTAEILQIALVIVLCAVLRYAALAGLDHT